MENFISMDKKYRTKDSRSVRIICIDRKSVDCPVVALIGSHNDNYEGVFSYTNKGKYLSSSDSNLDLVEMEPIPDKALVWCWEKKAPCSRLLKFYDAINKSTFSGEGERNYVSYSNYEVISPEEEPKWAKEARKHLKD